MQENPELSQQNWVFDQLYRGITTHSVHFLRTFLRLDYVDDAIGEPVDLMVVRRFEGGIEVHRTIFTGCRNQFSVREEESPHNSSPHTRQQ